MNGQVAAEVETIVSFYFEVKPTLGSGAEGVK
jgi:hypothetical protein